MQDLRGEEAAQISAAATQDDAIHKHAYLLASCTMMLLLNATLGAANIGRAVEGSPLGYCGAAFNSPGLMLKAAGSVMLQAARDQRQL